MVETCEFDINAQYIKNGPISFLGTRLNEFQEMLLFLCKNEEDIDYIADKITYNNKKMDKDDIKRYFKKYEEYNNAKVIFIHSPTGTGKTRGMILPTLLSYYHKFPGIIIAWFCFYILYLKIYIIIFNNFHNLFIWRCRRKNKFYIAVCGL